MRWSASNSSAAEWITQAEREQESVHLKLGADISGASTLIGLTATTFALAPVIVAAWLFGLHNRRRLIRICNATEHHSLWQRVYNLLGSSLSAK